ncbi:hypothetical protein Tco_0236614 [Tanacetum coccineum]
MVACLEKTEGNSDFHEIVDFLASSSIHHALTVSPPIYTSYIEQFWNTVSSQTVNDVKHIDATVDSKAVVVTAASIRSSLLFNDVDVGEPFNDVYPTPAHNLKVFSNMSRKGVKFSGKVTSLFDSMLVLHQAPEGEDSRDSLEETNRNEGDQVQTPDDSPLSGGHTTDSSWKGPETYMNYLFMYLNFIQQAKALPPQGMVKRVEKYIMNKRFGNQESVSKKGRKKSKPESTLDDNTIFDDQGADHGMEYMETEEAMDEGRQSGETEEVKLTDDTEVIEDKSSGDKEGNAEELVSTARPEISQVRKVNVIISSLVKGQRERKTPMFTEDVQATKRTKEQIRQEEADLAEAMRLQALQDEEAARQVHLDALLAKRISEEQELSEQQEKRKAEVQEAAQHYSEEDWDNIRAKLEANAELVKDVLGENVTSIDFAKRMVEMINQKKKYYAEQARAQGKKK